MREADGDLGGVVGPEEIVPLAVVAPVPRRELGVLGKLGREESCQAVTSGAGPYRRLGRGRMGVTPVRVGLPEAEAGRELAVLLPLVAVAQPGHDQVHAPQPSEEGAAEGHDAPMGEDALESVHGHQDAKVEAEEPQQAQVGPQLATHVLLRGGPAADRLGVVVADAAAAAADPASSDSAHQDVRPG